MEAGHPQVQHQRKGWGHPRQEADAGTLWLFPDSDGTEGGKETTKKLGYSAILIALGSVPGVYPRPRMMNEG